MQRFKQVLLNILPKREQLLVLDSKLAQYIPLPMLHRRLIVGIFLFLCLLVLFLPSPEVTKTPDQTQAKELSLPDRTQPVPPPEPKIRQLDPEDIQGKWRAYVIAKGDTLSKVFREMEVQPAELNQLLAAESKVKELSKIHPGQVLSFYQGEDGKLIQLRLSAGKNSTAIFTRLSEGGFSLHHKAS